MASLVKNSGTTAKTREVFPRAAGFSETTERRNPVAPSTGGLTDGGVAGVSHELRNLLTALNIYSDLLAEPGVLALAHSHMAEELKLIVNAGKSLLDNLNRMPTHGDRRKLVFETEEAAACPESAQSAEPASGTVTEQQLAPVLDSCLPLLAHLAGPQVHVHLKCARNHGDIPLSSEDLTMILVNLVRNAAEAMPGGGGVWIAIQPAVKSYNGTAKCARIVVEDDGPGIPADARTHLFERGFTTKKPSAAGGRAVAWEHHGLGLAIVRRQVENAGGVIEAGPASTRGGARFEIRIPVGNHQGATKVADVLNGEYQRTNHKDEGTRVKC